MPDEPTLGEIVRRLGSIETKVDAIPTAKEFELSQEAQDRQIRSIDRKGNILAAGLFALSGSLIVAAIMAIGVG